MAKPIFYQIKSKQNIKTYIRMVGFQPAHPSYLHVLYITVSSWYMKQSSI